MLHKPAFIYVMVNFMCPLDCVTGHPDIWLNIISGHVYEGLFRRDQHLNWWTR